MFGLFYDNSLVKKKRRKHLQLMAVVDPADNEDSFFKLISDHFIRFNENVLQPHCKYRQKSCCNDQ